MTSLYDRLGQGVGIRRLVEDIMDGHLANPLIRSRFEGIADLSRAKKLAWEFLCVGAGGPETYTGRAMLEAHRHMNVSEQEFLAATDDILAALDKNGVGEDSRKDVLAILYSLKGDIIRV